MARIQSQVERRSRARADSRKGRRNIRLDSVESKDCMWFTFSLQLFLQRLGVQQQRRLRGHAWKLGEYNSTVAFRELAMRINGEATARREVKRGEDRGRFIKGLRAGDLGEETVRSASKRKTAMRCNMRRSAQVREKRNALIVAKREREKTQGRKTTPMTSRHGRSGR